MTIYTQFADLYHAPHTPRPHFKPIAPRRYVQPRTREAVRFLAALRTWLWGWPERRIVAHSLVCLRAQRARAQFERTYHACPTCQGWGEICYSEDPSPAGVSLSSGRMDYAETCGCITEQGQCPRCGRHVDSDVFATEDDTVGCEHCGWHHEQADRGMPLAECWCGMVQYEISMDRLLAWAGVHNVVHM